MDEEELRRRFRTPRGIMSLWAGWVLGPVGWALHQNAGFWIIPALCGGSRSPLWAISAVSLAVTAAGAAVSWRALRLLGGKWPKGEGGSTSDRSRFIAAGGVAVAALSALGIVIESAGIAVLDFCVGIP